MRMPFVKPYTHSRELSRLSSLEDHERWGSQNSLHSAAVFAALRNLAAIPQRFEAADVAAALGERDERIADETDLYRVGTYVIKLNDTYRPRKTKAASARAAHTGPSRGH
jgi:hypothetical protein